jgi:hypothetical protein
MTPRKVNTPRPGAVGIETSTTPANPRKRSRLTRSKAAKYGFITGVYDVWDRFAMDVARTKIHIIGVMGTNTEMGAQTSVMVYWNQWRIEKVA